MVAGSTLEQPMPPDAEARLGSFTELVATAIANADSRAELTASRARIVAAADETRRRIERDLHDGTQQQLVSVMLDLRQVQAAAPPELDGELSRIAGRVNDVIDQVREISHGIHPAILSERGLTPALKALARRSAVPVELDLRTGRRLPDHVEAAAYYAVSEALANAAKHARASIVHVELERRSRRAAGDPRRRDRRRRPRPGIRSDRAPRPHRGGRRHARRDQPEPTAAPRCSSRSRSIARTRNPRRS